MFRALRLTIMLVAAVGLPYVWSNQQVIQTVRQKIAEFRAGAGQSSTTPDSEFSWAPVERKSTADPDNEALAFSSAATSSGDFGTAVDVGSSLENLFHFGITPRSVSDRWPRVSTVRDEELIGMRVAVVTGTSLTDIAGSLTYYFDDRQTLKRITFHGQAGDERRLARHLVSNHQLRSEPSLGAGMYVARWNGRPTSVLSVRHAPVLRANAPHERLEISLELNHPKQRAPLSSHSQTLVSEEKRRASGPFWRRQR